MHPIDIWLNRIIIWQVSALLGTFVGLTINMIMRFNT